MLNEQIKESKGFREESRNYWSEYDEGFLAACEKVVYNIKNPPKKK